MTIISKNIEGRLSTLDVLGLSSENSCIRPFHWTKVLWKTLVHITLSNLTWSIMKTWATSYILTVCFKIVMKQRLMLYSFYSFGDGGTRWVFERHFIFIFSKNIAVFPKSVLVRAPRWSSQFHHTQLVTWCDILNYFDCMNKCISCISFLYVDISFVAVW